MIKLEYGPVFVCNGEHSGRIGDYDDDDTFFSSDEDVELDILERDDWIQAPDSFHESESDEKILEVAIVYFGGFFLAKGYYFIPMNDIRPVTTDDLITRREELHDLCGGFSEVKHPDLELDPDEEGSYLRELHYIDSVLVDRMILARYSGSKKGKGMNVFISHASTDKSFAKWIATDLKAAGHKPWLDEWEIKIGESIPNKISSGVAEADFLIVILSESSVQSNWVEREWQNKYWDEVNSGDVQVLPVMFKDCEIPELLKTKKYADFRNGYNDGLEDVLAAINHLSNQL